MLIKIILLVSFFSSCSYFKRDNKAETPTANEALSNKKAFYCAEGKRVLAERGFMDSRCDSLLFTALWSTACGPVDLTSWEDIDTPGKWHRNPNRDCFLNGQPNGSASSISRDMFLGLFHHIWSTKDKTMIQDIVNYGEEHNWIMGEAKDNETLLSRCLMTPQLISLAKDIKSGLFGLAATRQSSDDAVGTNVGFRAHLDILRILLSGRVRGGVSDSELSTLKDQAKRQPHNALYVAAYEKYSGGNHAAELLLSQEHFPNDRLPTTANHCINYLHSRDEGDEDWKPCAEAPLKEHDGTDFVFAAWVVLGEK